MSSAQLYLILFCCLLRVSSQGQELQNGGNALQIYPFLGKYIDLETMESFDSEELIALTFKTQSIYAPRFRGLAIDKLAFKGKLFEVQSDNGLLFTDLSTKEAMPLPNRERGVERYGQNFLIEAADGMVYIKYLNSDYGFMVYKYDAAGNEKMAQQIAHSDLIERPNLSYQRPYLKYFAHTKWQLVFSSYIKDKPKTMVLELSNGQLLEYDFTVQGIIRDEAEDAFIHGFISLDADKGLLQITYKSDVFELSRPIWRHCNQVETLLKGDTLLLACYNERNSGLALAAIDLKTKTLIWEADSLSPKLVKTEEGKYYFNMIWLSLWNNKVIIEGKEPQLRYLQIFDLATGAKLKDWHN